MAALASRIFWLFFAGSDAFVMRVFGKCGPDIRVAGLTHIAANIVGSKCQRCEQGKGRGNPEQEHDPNIAKRPETWLVQKKPWDGQDRPPALSLSYSTFPNR
jgi:hypothetical protein